MSHLLYFLPRLQEQHVHDIQELITAGASWLESDAALVGTYTVSGPGELAGAIVAVGRADATLPASIRYEKQHQRWLWHPSKTFMIGVDQRSKPRPEELRRNEVWDGATVLLSDKHEWVIPVCVPETVAGMSGETLPMVFDLDEGGKAIQRVDPDYEAIAGRAYAYFEEYTGMKKDKSTPETLITLACDVLAINYQVDRTIAVGLLGLFGTRTWALPVRAAIEADAIDRYISEQMAAASKKAPEGGAASGSGASATNSGSTDATPQDAASPSAT